MRALAIPTALAVHEFRGAHPSVRRDARNLRWINDRLDVLLEREGRGGAVRGAGILFDGVAWLLGYARPRDIIELMKYHAHCVKDFCDSLGEISMDNRKRIQAISNKIGSLGFDLELDRDRYDGKSIQIQRIEAEQSECRSELAGMKPKDPKYFSIESRLHDLEGEHMNADLGKVTTANSMQDHDAIRTDLLQRRKLLHGQYSYICVMHKQVLNLEDYLNSVVPVNSLLLNQGRTIKQIRDAKGQIDIFVEAINYLVVAEAQSVAHVIDEPSDLQRLVMRQSDQVRSVATVQSDSLDRNQVGIFKSVNRYLNDGVKDWEYGK